MVAVATILVAMERVTAATVDMVAGIQVTPWATALIPSIDQASVSSLVLGMAVDSVAIEVGLVAAMEATTTIIIATMGTGRR